MSIATTHDIGAFLKAEIAISPQNTAPATINGPEIDRQGKLSMVITGQAGAATGSPTAQSVIYKLQDTATTGGSFADVTGGAAAALTTDDSIVELDIDLAEVKRFVRVVAIIALTAGSTPKIDVACAAVFGGADTLPAT